LAPRDAPLWSSACMNNWAFKSRSSGFTVSQKMVIGTNVLARNMNPWRKAVVVLNWAKWFKFNNMAIKTKGQVYKCAMAKDPRDNPKRRVIKALG